MRKKSCVFAAMVLVAMSIMVCAQAEKGSAAVPSKSAYDVSRLVGVRNASGTDVQGWTVEIEREENPQIQHEMDNFRRHVKENKLPVITYFSEENQREIISLLGEGADGKDLILYDYLPLATVHYEETFGEAVITFSFASRYTPGRKVVVMLGLMQEDGQRAWFVCPAEVTTDGRLEVVFTQEALSGMGKEPGLMLVLSEPLAL